MVEINPTEIKFRMSKAIDSFKKDLSSLRVGRASSSRIDQITVNASNTGLSVFAPGPAVESPRVALNSRGSCSFVSPRDDLCRGRAKKLKGRY
jgi:hypothetical protein